MSKTPPGGRKPAIRYYTRKRAVPLKPGQTVGYVKGKGYWAKPAPAKKKAVAKKPKPVAVPHGEAKNEAPFVQQHKPPPKPIVPARKPVIRVIISHLNPRPSVRARIVKFAYWGAAHEPQIHYRESRPIPQVKPGQLEALPFTTDCSGFVTMAYQYAGAPDPNGNGYDNGRTKATFTGSLLKHGTRVPLAQVKPGDVVVYGPGTGWHTALVVKGGSDPLTVSHGQEGGPQYCRVSQDGRQPQTYLRFPTGVA